MVALSIAVVGVVTTSDRKSNAAGPGADQALGVVVEVAMLKDVLAEK
jgi:hypothetical protein